jgi:hypothetical protein
MSFHFLCDCDEIILKIMHCASTELKNSSNILPVRDVFLTSFDATGTVLLPPYTNT